ncbi:MAG: 16S rRNA (adenine(1518)-N(6)/adenine(1519)-N(6))-dimethyltransferase RsmA [Syntrophobacterales bacterium]|nr:16S rRNA (adenine(1518)-N(6)/adenine(1519)-N(6))-dimethyltransferase RsmA [Syntrophobacterales bacterium]
MTILKKSLSQHLIKDKNITDKMVRAAGVNAADTVVEVGAGYGHLTRSLCEKAGLVYAVEFDRACLPFLEALQEEHQNLRIVLGDILETPLHRFRIESNLKVIGNIPYQITAPILFKLLKERAIIDNAYLTMQKEIALRIVSKPFTRAYGAISAACQIFADVKVLFLMKPGLFVPPPKIDSAFLSMEFKDKERGTDDRLMEFVRVCFQNKRKYLKYALSKHMGEEQIETLYRRMGFAASIRAEEIEPAKLKEMYLFLGAEGYWGMG